MNADIRIGFELGKKLTSLVGQMDSSYQVINLFEEPPDTLIDHEALYLNLSMLSCSLKEVLEFLLLHQESLRDAPSSEISNSN